MRNLKKILALVLALMMALSVMVFASAKNLEDYTDAADVSEDYAEAVDVLTGMGIFEGDEEGFRPQDPITRAEVATLVYRVLTHDVTNANVGRYVGLGYFTDVPDDEWYAGYVNYVANGKHVVGTAEGIYAPDDDITGFEVLTIMLRAIGYGQNKEFEGDEWTIHVAQVANQLGISDGVDTPLSQPITREEVAYVIFEAIQQPQVTYTPALGYDNDSNPVGTGTLNQSLGYQEFGLEPGTKIYDNYYRPGHSWDYNTGEGSTFIEYAPVATYYTAETMCDVADDVNGGKSFTANVYLDGLAGSPAQSTINATNTTTEIGAQGRATEIYDADRDGVVDRIVYVDTYLAEVTGVTSATYDTSGHLVDNASLTFKVGTSSFTKYSATNYTYSVGDYLLVTTHNNFLNASVIDIVGVPTVTQVTVRGTVGLSDTTNSKYGVEATTGTQYLKNVTSTQAISDSMINQTYNLYLDEHGNIMIMKLAGAPSVNVGVVTASELRYASTGRYVGEVELYLIDGTTATVNMVRMNGTTPEYYTSVSDANFTVQPGHFIEFTSTTLNGTTYYYVSETGVAVADSDSVVTTGVADTLSNGTATLVDDTTKFIVTDYEYNYSTNSYDATYYVRTGFKNLPTLNNGNITYATLNGGDEILITSTGNPSYYKSVNQAQYTPDDSYLVLSKVNVTYEHYSVYNVVKNGVMTTVNISHDIDHLVDAYIDTNVLVTFDGMTNSGYYTKVDASTQTGTGTNAMASTNLSVAHEVTYSNGVLKVVNGAYTKYLTVADNCTVQIVNRVENTVYSATLSHIAQYEPTHAISFELDANGYVSYLYIID